MLSRVFLANLPSEVASLSQIRRFGFQPQKIGIRSEGHGAFDSSLQDLIQPNSRLSEFLYLPRLHRYSDSNLPLFEELKANLVGKTN